MGYSPFWFYQQSEGSSTALVTNYTNSTVSPIPQGTPVSSTGVADHIAPTDVTDENSVHRFVGFAEARIAASGNGPVISGGRLQNLTGWSFSIGDAIYIGLGGILQNVKPDYGVTGFGAGDFVVFCGVIVQNEDNSLNQDLQVMAQVIGEL